MFEFKNSHLGYYSQSPFKVPEKVSEKITMTNDNVYVDMTELQVLIVL